MDKTLLFIAVLLILKGSYCQTVLVADHSLGLTVPEIALLDIEPDNSALNLGFNIPTEAGLPIASSIGGANTKWINYTNSINPLVSGRSIEVQISSNTLPPGIEIIMEISAYSGNGGGEFGISSGLITLSTAPQTCIYNIGGSYTGNGVTNGHQLSYSLGISDYDLLDAHQSTIIELTFTLVDN